VIHAPEDMTVDALILKSGTPLIFPKKIAVVHMDENVSKRCLVSHKNLSTFV